MPETIFQIDPQTKKAIALRPVSFATMGVSERSDLQSWIIEHPQILGEALLVITSEFAAFDKSSKRLDILALDEEATLTVVELKLDASGTLADLQAVRYAAFCSTMTPEQLVAAYAEFHEVSTDEAQARILEFLGRSDLPRLDREPRIILAAGAIDDQELTASVLWLRRFNLDISCVEMTPYRLPEGNIVLVPRTVIPIPEARDYMVRVEQKQASEIQSDREESAYAKLWSAIVPRFNALGLVVCDHPFSVERISRAGYLQMGSRYKRVHYEWVSRVRAKALDVSIHFEADDEVENERLCKPLVDAREQIQSGVPETLLAGKFGDRNARKKWREVRFRIPADDPREPGLAPRAVDLMKVLIERTYPLLQGTP